MNAQGTRGAVPAASGAPATDGDKPLLSGAAPAAGAFKFPAPAQGSTDT